MNSEEEILRKLDEIESRLSGLENGNGSKKIMIEEKTEISGEGELESKETAKENSGIVKTKRVPVCDHCGQQLTTFSICKKCGKKLDEKCSVKFRNQVICPDDLRGVYPLSRPGFKVLLLLANNINNQRIIHRISGIPKNDVREIVQFLIGSGYVESSLLYGQKTSERGREVIFAYSQLWGGTGDMLELDEGIRRHVIQRS